MFSIYFWQIQVLVLTVYTVATSAVEHTALSPSVAAAHSLLLKTGSYQALNSNDPGTSAKTPFCSNPQHTCCTKDWDQLLFLHIPKSGGTALYYAIKDSFSADPVRKTIKTCINRATAHIQNPNELDHMCRGKDAVHRTVTTINSVFPKTCRFLRLHYDFSVVTDVLTSATRGRLGLVTIMRSPPDRVTSAYRYAKEVDGNLKDFVQGDGGAKANRFGGANHATKQMAGVLSECSQLSPSERRELLEDDDALLARAKRNLEAFCVLVYEYLPESLEYLSKVYGVKAMKLRPMHYNAGDRRPVKHDRHELIIEENRLDMLLYAYSVELFSARYKAVTGKELPPKASALSAIAEARAVQAGGGGTRGNNNGSGSYKAHQGGEVSTALAAAAALRQTTLPATGPGASPFSHTQGASSSHAHATFDGGPSGGPAVHAGAKHAPHQPSVVQIGGISMNIKAKRRQGHPHGPGGSTLGARSRLQKLAGSFHRPPIGGIFSSSKRLAQREALKAASKVSLQAAKAMPGGSPAAQKSSFLLPHMQMGVPVGAAGHGGSSAAGHGGKGKSSAVVAPAVESHVVALGMGSSKVSPLVHSLAMSNKAPQPQAPRHML